MESSDPGYRLWVSVDGKVLFRLWGTAGKETLAEVATRSDNGATWGPPIKMIEEKV